MRRLDASTWSTIRQLLTAGVWRVEQDGAGYFGIKALGRSKRRVYIGHHEFEEIRRAGLLGADLRDFTG